MDEPQRVKRIMGSISDVILHRNAGDGTGGKVPGRTILHGTVEPIGQ